MRATIDHHLSYPARVGICIWAVAGASLLSLSCPALAATITNVLGAGDWLQYDLAVNVGDTVVWVNQTLLTNSVESYDDEWKSPPLKPQDSFSYTFTNAGFYAYRAPYGNGSRESQLFGAITAVATTDPPPTVTINLPVEGSLLPPLSVVQASVPDMHELANIQYYANGALIGEATNAPYAVTWFVLSEDQYVLQAKATDNQGRESWSSRIHVRKALTGCLWGARRLPRGEILFFFNGTRGGPDSLAFAETPVIDHGFCSNTNTRAALFDLNGVFVDESAKQSPLNRRFYTILGNIYPASCP